MLHTDITDSDSTKLMSCFEWPGKIACSSGSVCDQTTSFGRWMEEPTLNWLTHCFHYTKDSSQPVFNTNICMFVKSIHSVYTSSILTILSTILVISVQHIIYICTYYVLNSCSCLPRLCDSVELAVWDYIQ